MIYEETLPASAAERALTRADLFREKPWETAERIALGLAWQLQPQRIAAVPALAGLHLRDFLAPAKDLPDPEAAFDLPEGFAGIARDLSVPNLVAAYSRGLYPHSHVLAPKWHSPPERAVLFYPDFHISKRFKPHIRQEKFRVSFDRGFDRVVKACADRREKRWHLTWITPKIMAAYAALHDAGYAHSFEVWNSSGDLVGGGYGVAVGRSFSVESMFCWEDNSSKVGFTWLTWHLAHWGFDFTDNKTMAAYKSQLGFKPIPRADYLARLAEAVQYPTKRGRWEIEADAATVAAWQPGRATGG
jgi:leucyl/phenylalanyl-tRNA--protein transferase